MRADVMITTDAEEACKGVDIAVMVGGFPRKGGMERKDVMAKNVAIYKSQAAALESKAKPDVKVLLPRLYWQSLLFPHSLNFSHTTSTCAAVRCS